MFDPITLPFGSKMLFNTVKLAPGVSFEEVELAVGDMCNVVKETYGGDKGGFIAGQVFKFSGFVSDEGSLNASRSADEHYVIVRTGARSKSTRNRTPTRPSRASSRRWRRCAPTPRSSATTCCGRARPKARSDKWGLTPFIGRGSGWSRRCRGCA